jgi:hypothetical protein
MPLTVSLITRFRVYNVIVYSFNCLCIYSHIPYVLRFLNNHFKYYFLFYIALAIFYLLPWNIDFLKGQEILCLLWNPKVITAFSLKPLIEHYPAPQESVH